MRRDQRPVQVEPDAEPVPQAHPVSHRQARDNAQLASMKLEREAFAHRFANLAMEDHARILVADSLKRLDEQIERFEQMLQEGQ